MRRLARLIAPALLLAACTTPASVSVATTPTGWPMESIAVRQKPGGSITQQPTHVLTEVAATSIALDRVDEWGGTLDVAAQPATGFFRVQKLGARWWLIDPEGRPFIHAGLVDTQPGSSPNSEAAFAKRYANTDDWARSTAQWLRDKGFNGVGAWSDTGPLGRAELRVPQARIVNFMSDFAKARNLTHVVPGHTGYPNDAIPVFEPAFEAFAMQYAKRLTSEANNPAIIGWFSDNEMPLEDRTLDNFLKLPDGDANGDEARRWLAARQGKPLADRAAITLEDHQVWVGYVYETYARIVSRAIRQADPHHLYLGSRFHNGELRNPHVFAAAGKYLDVIAVNYYRTWTPDQSLMANWAAWSGKPILITEWYVKGEDSGLPNTTGAGWLVPTQAARGQFYQHFVLGLLESRVVVGWHWFKYQDNDPDDPKAEPSNRDANKGMLDIRYAPYAPLVEAASRFNLRKYGLIRTLDQATGNPVAMDAAR